MASGTRITELAALIAKKTAMIDEFLVGNDSPTPSLDADAPESLPIPAAAADIKAARLEVIEACSELAALLVGPRELLRVNWTAYTSVKALIRFKLDRSFAVGESTTFEAMSAFSGLSETNVRRLVRHAVLNHRFFREETPGVVTHSALTAILNRDDLARNALVVELDEFWPAACKMADAMEKWPNSEESKEAGFALANNSSEKGLFEILMGAPDRAARGGLYFALPNTEATEGLLGAYPWGEHSTVVDVGGSHGSVAISVAERFPHVKCVVQDLPDIVAGGAARLPAGLRDRVTFMAHDFFTEQPVTADLYYFRTVFHNWADKYCVKILRALIPALRPGARILIHERVLPGFESLRTEEARRAIHLDLGMLLLLNARERQMREWPVLFHQADPGFRYLGARQPPGDTRWLIEAEWRGAE